MPNIKKIPKTVEITFAVIQRQVPNIAKTDEIRQAPNIQEIQIEMLQRSAVRERSGGYARCEGQARAIQTRRRHRGPH